METLKPILADQPFLKGLAGVHLDLMAGCASNVRFSAGEFLFREGEEANHFYLVRHGRVAIEVFAAQRGTLTIETIGEGDLVGWSWLVAPYHWRFDARAIELTRAIAFDARCLRGKCEHDHDLGYELLKRFALVIEQRLQATRMQLLDLYGSHV